MSLVGRNVKLTIKDQGGIKIQTGEVMTEKENYLQVKKGCILYEFPKDSIIKMEVRQYDNKKRR